MSGAGSRKIDMEAAMEKNKIIKMLDKAKYRMTDREDTGLSAMMAIMEALGYIIEKLDREVETVQQMAAEDSSQKPVKALLLLLVFSRPSQSEISRFPYRS